MYVVSANWNDPHSWQGSWWNRVALKNCSVTDNRWKRNSPSRSSPEIEQILHSSRSVKGFNTDTLTGRHMIVMTNIGISLCSIFFHWSHDHQHDYGANNRRRCPKTRNVWWFSVLWWRDQNLKQLGSLTSCGRVTPAQTSEWSCSVVWITDVHCAVHDGGVKCQHAAADGRQPWRTDVLLGRGLATVTEPERRTCESTRWLNK